MRIDSQGYASVMVPDDSDTTDCLRPRRCPFHVSTESLDPMRSPNDYEVPAYVMAETEETVRKGSLARQKAVLSVSEHTQEEVASLRVPDSKVVAQAGIQTIDVLAVEIDNESVESVVDQDACNEEVFDSGFENSNEGLQLTSPRMSESVPPPIPPRAPRALSLVETERDTLFSHSYRPRAKTSTLDSSKPSAAETNKKLCILLNHQSGVVV